MYGERRPGYACGIRDKIKRWRNDLKLYRIRYAYFITYVGYAYENLRAENSWQGGRRRAPPLLYLFRAARRTGGDTDSTFTYHDRDNP